MNISQYEPVALRQRINPLPSNSLPNWPSHPYLHSLWQIIIIYNPKGMSSIIDRDLFIDEQKSLTLSYRDETKNLPQNICKAMKSRDQHFLVVEDNYQLQAVKRVDMLSCEHLVRVSACRSSSTARVAAILLDGPAYYCTISRQTEIVLKKELLKRQRECTSEANFCVHQGRVMLILNNLLVLPAMQPHQMAKVYMQIIAKNLAHFTEIQNSLLRIGKRVRAQPAITQLHQQLFLSSTLSTTQSNVDLSCDKSQYRFAMREIQKQNIQLQSIQANIIVDTQLERSVRGLFVEYPESIQSEHLRANFISLYRKDLKSFRQLLERPLPIEKRAQDYLHSAVEVQILQKLADRPIGQGGTSLIFPFKATITFQNQQKIEKRLAIKRLRPGCQNKMGKMDHEKAIVSKLTNSICHFLPKYYAVQNNNQLKNCLLMELIRGDELDAYMSRHTSISLWSKLYIVINIIQGIRHLIEQGIVHLDLKPVNIFVCPQLITKIIDYGEAYHRDICHQNYVPGFTFPYVAPEVVGQVRNRSNKFQYSEKQDAFAFGIILSEVFFNDRIFYLSSQKFKESYSWGEQLERFVVCPQNLEAFGDKILMQTLLLAIDRCIGQPSRRPRFEWMNIILRLMHDSYINTY